MESEARSEGLIARQEVNVSIHQVGDQRDVAGQPVQLGIVDVAYFLLATPGTSQPVVDKLAGAIDKALQNPKVKGTLLAQGIEEKRGDSR